MEDLRLKKTTKMGECATIDIQGPINYKTEIMGFCCRKMKYALYRAELVYNGKGVKLWGGQEYLSECPYCKTWIAND